MNEQDLKSFVKWVDDGGEVPDEVNHGDLFIIWSAALEQERERSKKLVEAIEYHVAYSAPSFTKSQLEDALKEYRGEKWIP